MSANVTARPARPDRLRQLPPPFEKVSVRSMTLWSDVHIEYIGNVENLIECGAIESTMVQKGSKGRARFDSHGDRYRRRALPNGRLHLTRIVTSLERVLSLPGGCIDRESEIARLLANPALVLYERCNCWHHWWGSKERLARELDFSRIAVCAGSSYVAWAEVGLCGFVKVYWCEGCGSDPRRNTPGKENATWTQEIMDCWHQMTPEQQKLFSRFAQLLPTARGDELAQRRLRRGDLDLQGCVEFLERREDLCARSSHGVAPVHPRVQRRLTEA